MKEKANKSGGKKSSRNSNIDKVRQLLDDGADIEKRNHMGQTLLMLTAMKKGHSTCVKMLLDRGADMHAVDNYESSSIAYACMYRRVDNLRVMLDRGGDVNIRGAYGMTPLMQAAVNGAGDCVALLLERGADPTSTCNNGRTAFSYCAKTSKIKKMLADAPKPADYVLK